MAMVKSKVLWSRARLRLKTIRKALAAGRCHDALMLYNKLPDAIRWDDNLGPLRAKINSCSKRRR